MAGSPINDVPEKLNRSRLAAAMMAVGAGLLFLIATVWALVRFWEISRADQPTVGEFVLASATMLAAWSLSLLLWGAAEILRKLDDLIELWQDTSAATRGVTAEAVAVHPGDDQAAENQARLLQQLVQLTREVRDIEMLSAEERADRLRAEGEQLARQLEAEVPTLLREHSWLEARRRVQEARLRFPSLPNWNALEDQIDQAREGVEAQDFDAATREVDDLISLGAWERATEAVRDLQQRHPDSPRVGQLAHRVQLGREKAAAEERARLMAMAQEATDRRDWTVALRRVEEVLARYPNSLEAKDLREQLPTLRSNAEIQARQQMEMEIRDLIKDKRFADALQVARALIAQYPDSPQAAVLRDQLPRLEEKAGQPGGAPE